MSEHGPKDHWQVELEKTSKAGLVCLAQMLLARDTFDDRKEKLEWAKWARVMGRRLDLATRVDRFIADPLGDTRKSMRRAAAAKKAARRRKKERKAA